MEPLGGTFDGDLELARACLDGDASALEEFDGRLRAVAPRALAKIRLDPLSLEDLLQDVRAKLLVGAPGVAPKLGSYAGRGPLDGWLRVTIARAALSAIRARDPEASHREDTQAIVEGVAADNQELEALRARCAPALSAAIERAVAELSDAERMLLRLHLVDGLTIDDLAAVQGAHRATMARRLARVRNAIFENARSSAMRELSISEAEFASLMGVMLSRIDVTIRRLLEA
jgi:RNA polymerase sigma-70 factor (ECF subfamily)